MEFCDVVDASGARTGQVVPRGTELATGQFYLVVHVWIRDKAGNFLIQQRALHLASGPGVWATTAGYVLAGEDTLQGAIREVEEELGIKMLPTQFRRFKRHSLENRVEDIWLAEVPSPIRRPPILGPDVANWKWVSVSELAQLANRGDFFRYSYLDDLLSSHL